MIGAYSEQNSLFDGHEHPSKTRWQNQVFKLVMLAAVTVDGQRHF